MGLSLNLLLVNCAKIVSEKKEKLHEHPVSPFFDTVVIWSDDWLFV